jgi:hypothetical protein
MKFLWHLGWDGNALTVRQTPAGHAVDQHARHNPVALAMPVIMDQTGARAQLAAAASPWLLPVLPRQVPA